MELYYIGIGPQGLGLAILHYKERGGEDKPIAIYMKDLLLTMDRFKRVWSKEFKRLNLRKFRPSQYPIRRICIRKGHITQMRKFKDFKKCDSISLEEIYPNNTLTNLLNFRGRTALLQAAEKGLKDVIWLLLTRSDVEANLEDENGRTALSHAVSGGHEVVIKMLLAQSNVKANLEDKEGQTPLSWAAERGHEAVVKLLLQTGKVDVESKDKKNGQTPRSWAAEGGHEAVVKQLLETGKADIESKGKYRRTPLSWAAAVVKLLRRSIQ